MEKMTVTRALAELKLLDDRIKKGIENSTFVDVYQERNPVKVLHFNMDKTIFENQVKSSFQAVNDLMKRRELIKNAVLCSNSKTQVKIKDNNYLVVEAIEKKKSIEFKKLLLNKMRFNSTAINNEITNSKIKLDSQVETMLTQNLGADKKAQKEDWDNIARPFLDRNELKIVDPINVNKKIEELDKEIDEFLTEVDFILSESNSKTEIEI